MHRETDDLVEYKYGFVRRAYRNGVFKILFVQDEDMISEINFSDNESEEEEYHEESALIQAIWNKSAITVCNALVSNGVVVG